VTPVHFYEPIPDTQSLPETLWSQPSELVGIDMNDSMQLDLLRNHFSKFRGEYETVPAEPPPGQLWPFHGTDVLVAYCMVRHFNQADLRGERFFFSWCQATAKTGGGAHLCRAIPARLSRKGFPDYRHDRKTCKKLPESSGNCTGRHLVYRQLTRKKLGETSIICFWKCCRA
jgi:hypothetical protein